MSLETFTILPRDINREILNIGTADKVSMDRLLLKHKQFINADSLMYNSDNQTLIPHYALNIMNAEFKFSTETPELEYNIKSISYPKLNSNFSANRSIPNNIKTVMDYMFNYWNFLAPGDLINFTFIKDGESKQLFIGPGILLDSEGRVLFCLAHKKEIILKLNAIKGLKKFQDFYGAFLTDSEIQKTLCTNILNENTFLIFSRDFCQRSEYSRFYKQVLAIFANGIKYNMDMLVTDIIEKHIYNLPYEVVPTLSQEFTSLAEKNNFCKEMTKKAILE